MWRSLMSACRSNGAARPVCAVVLAQLLERVGERALAPVGAQADVDVEDAFLLRLDPLQEFLREALEVFAVVDALLAAGPAGPSVDEQHFDIGCIAEFPAAEFACAQNGERAGFLVGQARCAIELGQLGLAVDEASLHNHLGQLRDGEREVREAGRRLQNVFHVDPEEFLVLEAIEGLFARRIGLDLGDDAVQLLSQGDLGLDEWGVPIIFQQRQEIHVLPPEKVFPQKIARAEESSQERVGFLVVDKVPSLFLPRLAGLLHDQIQELIERLQRLGRVRSPGQGMGELFDERGGQPQLLLVGLVDHLLAVAVADVEAVVQLPALVRKLRLADIDVAHGEGVGKGVQERPAYHPTGYP